MTTYPNPQLTAEDLERLTGCKQTAAQIRWLHKMGIPYVPNASGDPVVTWGVVDAAILGHRPQSETGVTISARTIR